MALLAQINSYYDYSHFPSGGGLTMFLEETKAWRTCCLFEFNYFPPTNSVAYDAEDQLGIMCPQSSPNWPCLHHWCFSTIGSAPPSSTRNCIPWAWAILCGRRAVRGGSSVIIIKASALSWHSYVHRQEPTTSELTNSKETWGDRISTDCTLKFYHVVHPKMLQPTSEVAWQSYPYSKATT